MIFSLNNIVLLLAALSTALMAGLFYNWTSAITVGLHRLPDKEYIAAMQSINRAIQNPVFFLSFFGAAILLPVCSYLHYQHPVTAKFYILLAAAIFYLAGVMAVTILGNIPLNNLLDKFNFQNASLDDAAKLRFAFEAKWNTLNTIRTVCSCISLVFILIACLYNKSEQGV
jgi:uncharacterized membrane protein